MNIGRGTVISDMKRWDAATTSWLPWDGTVYDDDNYDSGPNSITTNPVPQALTAAATAVNSLTLSNNTTTFITVTVTDTAGNQMLKDVSIGPNSVVVYPLGRIVMTGIKWRASAVGMVGQVRGKQ